MSTTRQVTLLQSWGTGTAARGTASTSASSAVRGRGRRGAVSGGGATSRVRGRGRRRGRGRGGLQPNSGQSSPNVMAFDEDEDDDDLCLQALSNFELVTNEVSKAFEEVNQSKQLPGFDPIAGDVWIYPTNCPVRDYQFNIVQTALYHNTMVCLPTGLGKTFIAAVVMYNFHRWYPNDLIIFMAPTRPLVTQQLDACHELMGIHPSKMVELTGHILPKRREELWKDKKVFFLTPQVMTSDLGRGSCLPEQVRCIVVDEAHKTLGNHAYAQVIKMMLEKNKCFRVLALSATPGNDLTAVQEVLKNLLISRVELRSETSSDILPYTHEKQVETIVVPLDDHINSVHNQMLDIFQTYTGKLMKQNVLTGSCLTQFQLLKARETFRQNQKPGIPNYQRGFIEVDFATCISLAHAIDLLLIHGFRCFYSFLHGVMCKEKGTPAVASELQKSTNIESILEEVKEKLNISDENSFFDLSTSGLFSTTMPKPTSSAELPEPTNPEDYLLSHPKMRVLRELVVKHFNSHATGTRIMIFSEYRDSVQEIGNMLNGLRPLIKPMVFLGQAKGAGVGGRGLRQKEQVQVVQSFRSGNFNVLVSTCVGEEGLDIGEVDLIICFDASKSPTRLVQRMGRTGRKREGKTIFLLAQGKEQRMYYSSVTQQRTISKTITDVSLLDNFLYKESPRMVPAGVVPQCYKMDIILSSEQKRQELQNDEPELIEIDEDSTLDEPKKTKSKIILPKSRSTSTKKSAKTASTSSVNSGRSSSKKSSRTVSASGSMDPNADSSSSVNTITRCFENMQQKQNSRSYSGRSSSTKDSNPGGYSDNNNEIAVIEIDNDMDVSFSHFDSEIQRVGIGADYQNHLKQLVGAKDVDAGSVVKCVFVPKLVPSDIQVPELCLEDLDEISREINVDQLREKLNAVYILGPTSNRCGCGMLLVDCDEMNDSDSEEFLKPASKPAFSDPYFKDDCTHVPAEPSVLSRFSSRSTSASSPKTTAYPGLPPITTVSPRLPSPITTVSPRLPSPKTTVSPRIPSLKVTVPPRLPSPKTTVSSPLPSPKSTVSPRLPSPKTAVSPRIPPPANAPVSFRFPSPKTTVSSALPSLNSKANDFSRRLSPVQDVRVSCQLPSPRTLPFKQDEDNELHDFAFAELPPSVPSERDDDRVFDKDADAIDLAFEAAFLQEEANIGFLSPSEAESEHDEPSPIFKRRIITPETPTIYDFDFKPRAGVQPNQNRTPPSKTRSTKFVNPTPDSPDFYPPSPVSNRNPRQNIARKIEDNPCPFEKSLLVKPILHAGTSQNTVTPVRRTSVASPSPPPSQPLRISIPSSSPAVEAPSSHPSSDTTCYNSDTSRDEEGLSPILMRSARRPPIKMKFSDRVRNDGPVEFQTPAPEPWRIPSEPGTKQINTQTPNRAPLESEPGSTGSPTFFPATQNVNRPVPKKLFKFRKRDSPATAPIIPFQELLNATFSPSRFGSSASTEIFQEAAASQNFDPEVETCNEIPTRNPISVQVQAEPDVCSPTTGETGFDSDNSDDLFFIPSNIPKPSMKVPKPTVPLRPPSVESVHMEDSPIQKRKIRRRPKGSGSARKKRRLGDGFVLDEAEVEGDESSDESELEDVDAYDESFVALEESPQSVTESQQVRYIASTKDTPKRAFGRKKSLDEVALDRILESAEDPNKFFEDYQLDDEEGEFCVPNDYIEYAAAGDFTQRMDEARIAIQLESPCTGFKRTLRSKTRRRQQQGQGQTEFKAPAMPKRITKAKRKRILVVSSDSE